MSHGEALSEGGIAGGSYGDATPSIITIIGIAESLQWFPRPRAEADLEVRRLVQDHLRLTGYATGAANRVAIAFVESNLSDAAALYGKLNAVSPGDSYASGAWRRTLGELAARVHLELEQPQFQAFIKPPLFPIPGKAGVLGGMLAASREKLAALTGTLADRDREMIWWLMCDVDKDFWEAVQWQVARGVSLDQNPFFLLVQAYSLGFYPLGVTDGRFVIYSRAS